MIDGNSSTIDFKGNNYGSTQLHGGFEMVDVAETTAPRQCRACHQRLPLDAEHFHRRHGNYAGGFRWI